MKKSAILIAALISAAPLWAAPPEGIATEATKAANARVAAELPIADQKDFENANRGFLAKIPGDKILNADGSVAWDSRQFDFVEGAAPDTVNPSLWRQAKLNSIHGLFEVVPGIYQIRDYDLAQMTLIAGKTGWPRRRRRKPDWRWPTRRWASGRWLRWSSPTAMATILAASPGSPRPRISRRAGYRSSPRTVSSPNPSAKA